MNTEPDRLPDEKRAELARVVMSLKAEFAGRVEGGTAPYRRNGRIRHDELIQTMVNIVVYSIGQAERLMTLAEAACARRLAALKAEADRGSGRLPP